MSLPWVAKNEICIEVIGELFAKPYIDITLKLMKLMVIVWFKVAQLVCLINKQIYSWGMPVQRFDL